MARKNLRTSALALLVGLALPAVCLGAATRYNYTTVGAMTFPAVTTSSISVKAAYNNDADADNSCVISYATSEAGTFTDLPTTKASGAYTASVSGLAADTTYYFKAVFNDADGYGSGSSPASNSQKTAAPPLAAPNSVNTAAIIDGAVTDAKITGPISGTKLGPHVHLASDILGIINASSLPIGTTAGTVAAGDHVHPEMQKYAGVVVVAKSGGDYTSLAEAMNSINPTADNPYLIKIKPGVYAEPSMFLKSYIDIQGSGTASTIIKPQFSGQSYFYGGGSMNGSMSNLSIIAENIPAAMAPYLFYLNNTSGYVPANVFKFINVDIRATSVGSFNIYGIASNANDVEFRNSSIDFDLKDGSYAIGIEIFGSELTVMNSKIKTNRTGASGNPLSIGLMQLGGKARIIGSEIESTDDLQNYWHAAVLAGGCSGGCGTTPDVFIANSTLKGNRALKTEVTNGVQGLISAASSQLVGEINGNVKLFNNYDANFSAINNQ